MPNWLSDSTYYLIFNLASWTLFGLLMLVALGYRARLLLLPSILLYFFYSAPVSWALNLHYNIPPLMVMILMAASKESRSWSFLDFLDRTKSQEIVSSPTARSIKLLLGLIYLGAAISKLRSQGFGWFDGSSFSAVMYQRYLLTENPISLWIGSHVLVCVILGALAVVCEFTFWTSVFLPRYEAIFALMGLSMHVVVLITMDINFLTLFAPIYLIYLPSLLQLTNAILPLPVWRRLAELR